MRLTTFILFAAFMQVSAAGIAQRLTLVQKSVTLKQFFNEVNKQTGYSIIWSVSQVRGNVEVDADFKDTPLLEALDKCLANTNLTYTIEDKTVVIREKEPTLVERIKKALNIAVTVSGKVVDETGQPLPGVTVKEKGTANGIVTDAKGVFSLTVADERAMITFSFIGFETQELIAKDIQAGSVISMKAATNNLKEVVINKGYYNEKRELSAGDVTIVNSKTIEDQPVTDPLMTLEGRVPGLYISQSSGVPGSQFRTVSLRGTNSISNGTAPLFIIDGVPFGSSSLTDNAIGGGAAFLSPFNSINPDDIEDIEILKDADATAIYGSRGANGIILITTKKGKSGYTHVDFKLLEGAGKITRMMNLLNSQQYLMMRHEAFKNDGKIPGPTAYDLNGAWDTTRYTDWQRVLIGGASHLTRAESSISGGDLTTQFLIGGGYSKQTTVFPGDYADQVGSLHVNINHTTLNRKFHVAISASYSSDDNIIPTVDFTNYITLPPVAPQIYNADGSLNWQNNTWNNPLATTYKKSKSITDNLISNLRLSYELFSGTEVSVNLGFNNIEMNQNITTPITAYPASNSSDSFLREHDFAGDSDEHDHRNPIQPHHPFRVKLTRTFRGKLTIPVTQQTLWK